MTYKGMTAALAVLILAQPLPAAAQGVTSEDVKVAFAAGVALCAKGLIAGGGIEGLSATERVALTIAGPDSTLAGRATEGQTIFDVAPAVGIVALMAKGAGECEVIGYGPRVLATYALTKTTLTHLAPNLRETEVKTTAEDYIATYELAQADGSKVIVRLRGGEPGMGSRMFRFPMFTANVTRSPS